MRGWQIKQLRAAGLDPYMRATWQEAQAAMAAQQSKPVIVAPAEPAAPVEPRGGKVAKPCPYCGQEFKALHWHVDKCKMRPAT